MIRFTRGIIHRFRAEQCARTAAALAFTTLLGLVPMLVVGVLFIEWLPFRLTVASTLEQFVLSTLLPDKTGTVVAKYLAQFAHRADRITWIGSIGLLITALLQMMTIEHTFNAIWRVRRQRPWLRRIGLHFLALLAGPLVFGAALASMTYLVTLSLGWINEPVWMKQVAGWVPTMFLAALFGLLYWALPNRPVSRWHAGIAGTMVALTFDGMQKVFAYYIVKLPTYALIYGAFAAIPIFLLWLYFSWAVVLIGALVTAELSGGTTR